MTHEKNRQAGGSIAHTVSLFYMPILPAISSKDSSRIVTAWSQTIRAMEASCLGPKRPQFWEVSRKRVPLRREIH